MALNLVCPECDHAHRVRDEFAGRQVRCKGCGIALNVPAAVEDDFEVDDFSEPGSDDFRNEDYGDSVSLPGRRRKSRKRKRQSEPSSKPQTFVNRKQLAVLVMILVMASRYGFVPSIWSIFSFRNLGLTRVIAMLASVASLLAYVALIIGGIGIFQREQYGAPLAEKAAWVKLTTVAIGLITSIIFAVQHDSAIYAIARMTSASAVLGIGIPIAIIYLIRHPDWDTPEQM